MSTENCTIMSKKPVIALFQKNSWAKQKVNIYYTYLYRGNISNHDESKNNWLLWKLQNICMDTKIIIIADHLTCVSWEKFFFPEALNKSTVSPIYKSGDSKLLKLLKGLKPITSSFSNIIWKHIFVKIIKCLV